MNPENGRKSAPSDPAQPLLKVENLTKHFPIRSGIFRQKTGAIKAVDGLSFEVRPGETFGLVGEQGSGKSTAGRAILQLLEPTAGDVYFAGQNVTKMRRGNLRKARRHMTMIFQNPYTSLNPRMTVGRIVAEPMNIHAVGTPQERDARVQELLKLVKLNPFFANRYPYEFSGSQRQRIGIARALATNPSFIVADEPAGALDVSVHEQVVQLLEAINDALGLTCLFISRSLELACAISDRIAIIYLGRIVEMGTRDDIYNQPLHPYTQALRSAIPLADAEKEAQRQPIVLTGNLPDPASPPQGCQFHPRCPFATDICRTETPPMRNLGASAEPHSVACHHAEQFMT